MPEDYRIDDISAVDSNTLTEAKLRLEEHGRVKIGEDGYAKMKLDGDFNVILSKAPDGYTYTLQEITYQETAEDGSIVNVKGWLMTDADQSKLFFDKYGVLKSITDFSV